MIYLWGVYSVLWAMTFGYVFYLSIQQNRLQQQLERLRRGDGEKGPPAPLGGAD
jgi:CcmD family protein